MLQGRFLSKRQRGRFAPHWELRSQAKTRAWALCAPSGASLPGQNSSREAITQNFTISQSSNFRPHTRFFNYRSISLKFSGYLTNTLNRHSSDFEHDRTFTFGVIAIFIFSRNCNFTRQYLTKVSKCHLPAISALYLPTVKISSKSVQPFRRYSANKKRCARTHGRTDERTNGRTDERTDGQT